MLLVDCNGVKQSMHPKPDIRKHFFVDFVLMAVRKVGKHNIKIIPHAL